MLFLEIIDIYFENHMKPTNITCVQTAAFVMIKQTVHIVTTVIRKVYNNIPVLYKLFVEWLSGYLSPEELVFFHGQVTRTHTNIYI
jgi:hypothetical protein